MGCLSVFYPEDTSLTFYTHPCSWTRYHLCHRFLAGATFVPREHLPMSGNILHCKSWVMWYWHLVGRGKGCYWTFYSYWTFYGAQDGPIANNHLVPNIRSAKLWNPGLCDNESQILVETSESQSHWHNCPRGLSTCYPTGTSNSKIQPTYVICSWKPCLLPGSLFFLR